MPKATSPRAACAINDMYARMAQAAAKKAIYYAGDVHLTLDFADSFAMKAEEWAKRAGGNAIQHVSLRG